MLGGIFSQTLGRPGMMGTIGASAVPQNPFQNQGTYQMKGGGLDVMGTFEKQNEELNQFRANPGANPFDYGGGGAGFSPGSY